MPVPMTPKFTVGIAKRYGRKPCNERFVPFQEILPLSLRNSVSGKGDKSTNVACLQEMAVMFACMKKHDFNEALCPKEINSFQTCFHNFDHRRQLEEAKSADDSDFAGVKGRLPYKQLNKILEKFPQPK